MTDQGDELWRRIHNPLRAFIAKRINNEADVDDLFQEVCARIYQHRRDIRQVDRLLPWIYRVTRNVIVDHYRAAQRQREREQLGRAPEDVAEQASVSLDSHRPGLHSELSDCIHPLINRLSAESRQALNLVEFDGLTQQEAAARLGLSWSGMKSRVQRGRRQLRTLLAACCNIELDRRRGIIDCTPRDLERPLC